ncbi:MAG: copper amine oxidase N-terminal domain-containing protein [Firmicutes bacterium]|nr:copper amine oxidase N-terminal domain-containing protein [Bacillota bacterium]
MKKALIYLLSAVLVLGMAIPVMAENGDYATDYEDATDYEAATDYKDATDYEDATGYEAATDYQDEATAEDAAEYELPSPPSAVGKIGYITAYGNNQLTVASLLDEEDIIVLNLGEGTIIIDAETGGPAVIADRTNDRVKVYHAAFMTMSIPPQSPALVVAINLPEYNSSPHYHVVEAINWADEDTLRLTVDNGGLIIIIDRETPLGPHLTRQMIELEHLQVGDVLLFWYEIIAQSLPAQTTATRALWLRSAEADEVEEYPEYVEGEYVAEVDPTDEYTEIIQGELIVVPPPQVAVQPPRNVAVPGTGVMRDGVEYFPVRALAVEAGFTVNWDSATTSAVLTLDGKIVILANNATTFNVDGAVYNLSAAAFIQNGVMYAPYDFFARIG